VPAVLGEFAQYVEVHPAQRERAAPVAVRGFATDRTLPGRGRRKCRSEALSG
jgi:hypothetical protein